MDLLLWRHAEAADGSPDLDRALTARGLDQAASMARWLTPRLPSNLRVLVSPARRAQETARALGRPFDTVDALSTGADVEALLAAAGWPDADRPVMLVGHQPTLGEVAAYLLKGDASLYPPDRKRDASPLSWRIGKGAIWWLRGRQRGNRDETVLLLAVEPAMIDNEKL